MAIGIENFLAANNVKFTMSEIQLNLDRFSNKQKYKVPKEEKSQATETDPDHIQMLELAYNDILNNVHDYITHVQNVKQRHIVESLSCVQLF